MLSRRKRETVEEAMARLGDAAATLAAWMAEMAHRQWLAGSSNWHVVLVPANARTLARLGRVARVAHNERELAELLEALTSVRIGLASDNEQRANTGRFVLEYFKAARTQPGEKGGRPSYVYVVTVGWPLIHTRLGGSWSRRMTNEEVGDG